MTRAEACREALKRWVALAYLYGDQYEQGFAKAMANMNPWVETWPRHPPVLELWRLGGDGRPT